MLVHHPPHHIVEVWIATVHNGATKVVLGMCTMAANDVTVAHDVGAFGNHALLHPNQALHHLED